MIEDTDEKKCGEVISNNKSSNKLRHIKRRHVSIYNAVYKKQNETPAITFLDKYIQNKISIKLTEKDFKLSILRMIVKDGVSFKTFTNEGFKTLVNDISRCFKFTLNYESIRNLVTEYAANQREVLSKLLRKKSVYLKIDGVTNHNSIYLGINVQFFNNNSIDIKNLGVVNSHGSHRSSVYLDIIENVLREYQIEKEQVLCITVDNAANMLSTIQILNDSLKKEFEDNYCDFDEDDLDIDFVDILSNTDSLIKAMPCVIHTLQLCVKDFIKSYDLKVIDKVRNIVKKLRNSNTIEVVKTRFKIVPVLDICTRWGSTYKMLEKFLIIKSLCLEYAAVDNVFFLSSSDYKKVENVVDLLKLPYNVTIALQKSDITAGEFFKHWCKLKVDLKKFSEMGECFVKSMSRRQIKFMNNKLFLAAVYVDSRYRILLSEEEQNLAKVELTFQARRRKYEDSCVVLVSSR